jgi:hypothetical protein
MCNCNLDLQTVKEVLREVFLELRQEILYKHSVYAIALINMSSGA